MSETKAKPLQPGTTPDSARLHKWIRRVCYVLLFGLVVEGAFVTPLTLIYYGWPTLSVGQICSELEQVMYSDKHLQCHNEGLLDAPPFGGKPAGAGAPSNDTWSAQPTPGYPKIGFRQLITIYNEEKRHSGQADPPPKHQARGSVGCHTTSAADITASGQSTLCGHTSYAWAHGW